MDGFENDLSNKKAPNVAENGLGNELKQNYDFLINHFATHDSLQLDIQMAFGSIFI
jgi:hypothetical protein